jgi:hypothetical protein
MNQQASPLTNSGLQVEAGKVTILTSYLDCSFQVSSMILALFNDYGLDDRGPTVRFPAGAENFSLHHCAQNGSVAHPASYPMGTRGSFPGVKAAAA